MILSILQNKDDNLKLTQIGGSFPKPEINAKFLCYEDEDGEWVYEVTNTSTKQHL